MSRCSVQAARLLQVSGNPEDGGRIGKIILNKEGRHFLVCHVTAQSTQFMSARLVLIYTRNQSGNPARQQQKS